jgi:hypothetical protein
VTSLERPASRAELPHSLPDNACHGRHGRHGRGDCCTWFNLSRVLGEYGSQSGGPDQVRVGALVDLPNAVGDGGLLLRRVDAVRRKDLTDITVDRFDGVCG